MSLLRLDVDDRQVVMHSAGAVCASTQELVESAAFARVLDLYIDQLESRRVMALELVNVEVQHARERGTLHKLLGARADGAGAVHDDLAVIDVESQQRHAAGDPPGSGAGWRRDHTRRKVSDNAGYDAPGEEAPLLRQEPGRANVREHVSRTA